MSDQPEIQDLSVLPLDAKIDLAVKMRMSGKRISEIANEFSVSKRTVYLWFSQHRDEFVQELEQLKHIDVFTDQLQTLQEYEAKILRVAARMGFDLDQPVPPGQKLKGKLADYTNLMKLAIQVRDQQIKLHGFAGTLPKQPERIYHTIAETSSKTGENKDDISKLPREELEKMTLKRLKEQLVL